MTAHGFQIHFVRVRVAQFVLRGKAHKQNAVAAQLGNIQNAASGKMLAHEHAEHGRIDGVDKLPLRKMRARIAGAGGKNEFVIFAVIAKREQQHVFFRLRNALHTRAGKYAV